MLRELGMFREGAARSDRTLQNHAWFCHCRGNNLRIIGLLGKAAPEILGLGAPRFRSRFHGRRCNGQIEEPERRLIGLKSSRHQSRACSPADH
jgi:hypothetical protein